MTMTRPSLRTIATALTALTLPIVMIVTTIAGAYYKTTNPADVDITQGLAYLRETMTIGVAVFVVCIVVIIGLIVAMYRRDHNFAQAKLPMALLATMVIIMGVVILTSNYTNEVQDQYLRDHNRPTTQEFFDRLEQQKQ